MDIEEKEKIVQILEYILKQIEWITFFKECKNSAEEDDDVLDIIDIVNEALKKYPVISGFINENLQFVCSKQ